MRVKIIVVFTCNIVIDKLTPLHDHRGKLVGCDITVTMN